MREFIDVTAEMAAHSKALDAIAKAIAHGDQVVSTYLLNTTLSSKCYQQG